MAWMAMVLGVGLFMGVPRSFAQFTDGLNVAFGKNRVQYRSFEWQYFEQGMFEVYHYREGDQIAGQVARILEEEAKAMSKIQEQEILRNEEARQQQKEEHLVFA